MNKEETYISYIENQMGCKLLSCQKKLIAKIITDYEPNKQFICMPPRVGRSMYLGLLELLRDILMHDYKRSKDESDI